jgi:hypothetical protein
MRARVLSYSNRALHKFQTQNYCDGRPQLLDAAAGASVYPRQPEPHTDVMETPRQRRAICHPGPT